jgi:uncharacterized membrane protein HdeD (DUF308 family)
MTQDDGSTTTSPEQVRNPFRRVWWMPVVRGVCYVVLGLLLMIEPLGQLEVLRLLLGAFLVLDAVLVCVQWAVHRRQVGSAWWLAQAGVNVLFGVAVAFWPDLGPTPLYYVLAAWAIVLGITAVVGGVALVRNRDLGWPWMVTFGLTAALFGLLLVTRPLDSLDVLRLVTIVFALFAFVAGVIHLVSGFAVRSVARELRGLRLEAERAGVVVTGGSVLGAANPQAASAAAAPPASVPPASVPPTAAPTVAAPTSADEPATDGPPAALPPTVEPPSTGDTPGDGVGDRPGAP